METVMKVMKLVDLMVRGASNHQSVAEKESRELLCGNLFSWANSNDVKAEIDDLDESRKEEYTAAAIKLHNKARNLPSSCSQDIRSLLKAAAASMLATFSKPGHKGTCTIVKLLAKSGQELQTVERFQPYAVKACTEAMSQWSRLNLASLSKTLPPMELRDVKNAIFECCMVVSKHSEDSSVSHRAVHSALELVQTLPQRGLHVLFIDTTSSIATKKSDAQQFTEAIYYFQMALQSIESTLQTHMDETDSSHPDRGAEKNYHVDAKGFVQKMLETKVILKISLAYAHKELNQCDKAMVCIRDAETCVVDNDVFSPTPHAPTAVSGKTHTKEEIMQAILVSRYLILLKNYDWDGADASLRQLLRQPVAYSLGSVCVDEFLAAGPADKLALGSEFFKLLQGKFPNDPEFSETRLANLKLLFAEMSTRSSQGSAGKVGDVRTGGLGTGADMIGNGGFTGGHIGSFHALAPQNQGLSTATRASELCDAIICDHETGRHILNGQQMEALRKALNQQMRFQKMCEDWNLVLQWSNAVMQLSGSSLNAVPAAKIDSHQLDEIMQCLFYRADAFIRTQAFDEAVMVCQRAESLAKSTHTLVFSFNANLHAHGGRTAVQKLLNSLANNPSMSSLDTGDFVEPAIGKSKVETLELIVLCLSVACEADDLPTIQCDIVIVDLLQAWLKTFAECKLWRHVKAEDLEKDLEKEGIGKSREMTYLSANEELIRLFLERCFCRESGDGSGGAGKATERIPSVGTPSVVADSMTPRKRSNDDADIGKADGSVDERAAKHTKGGSESLEGKPMPPPTSPPKTTIDVVDHETAAQNGDDVMAPKHEEESHEEKTIADEPDVLIPLAPSIDNPAKSSDQQNGNPVGAAGKEKECDEEAGAALSLLSLVTGTITAILPSRNTSPSVADKHAHHADGDGCADDPKAAVVTEAVEACALAIDNQQDGPVTGPVTGPRNEAGAEPSSLSQGITRHGDETSADAWRRQAESPSMYRQLSSGATSDFLNPHAVFGYPAAIADLTYPKEVVEHLHASRFRFTCSITIMRHHFLGRLQAMVGTLQDVELDDVDVSILGDVKALEQLADLGWNIGHILSPTSLCTFAPATLCDNDAMESAFTASDAESTMGSFHDAKSCQLLTAAQILEATAFLYSKLPYEDASIATMNQCLCLITAAAARLDLDSSFACEDKQSTPVGTAFSKGITSLTDDAQSGWNEERAANLQSIVTNAYTICTLLRNEAGLADRDSRREIFRRLAWLYEFTVACKSSPETIETFITSNNARFLLLSSEELMACSAIAERERGGTVDIVRAIHGFALQACAKESPANYNLMGRIFARLIELSPSRLQALEKIEEFEQLLTSKPISPDTGCDASHGDLGKDDVGVFSQKDIDFIARISYNYGVTLCELEQMQLAERFLSRSLSIAMHASASLKALKGRMEETYCEVLRKATEMKHRGRQAGTGTLAPGIVHESTSLEALKLAPPKANDQATAPLSVSHLHA